MPSLETRRNSSAQIFILAGQDNDGIRRIAFAMGGSLEGRPVWRYNPEERKASFLRAPDAADISRIRLASDQYPYISIELLALEEGGHPEATYLYPRVGLRVHLSDAVCFFAPRDAGITFVNAFYSRKDSRYDFLTLQILKTRPHEPDLRVRSLDKAKLEEEKDVLREAIRTAARLTDPLGSDRIEFIERYQQRVLNR